MSINHVGIIMDGNDRWAKAKGIKSTEGHAAGAKNAFKIIEASIEHGIKHLSLFTFSSENWNRPKEEIDNFLSILNYHVKNSESDLHNNNIRIRFIGDHSKLDSELLEGLKKLEEATKNYTKLSLYILLGYGGKAEIVHAAKKMFKESPDPESISEETFSNYLYAPEMPDLDLFIRAGNQMRVSNFLLWQLAYAELYFSKKLWPDFTKDDLKDAILEYNSRTRTFGLRDAK